jgi:hypothetical protein
MAKHPVTDLQLEGGRAAHFDRHREKKPWVMSASCLSRT